MVRVTVQLLTAIAKAAASPVKVTPNKTVMQGIVNNWRYVEDGGISTTNEIASFLGQACIETDYFKTLKEYWGPTAQQKKYDPASKSKLSRDLGNVDVGDGKKYMGRGIFQNTGRANYIELSNKFGVDFENNPDLIATPEWSVRCAVDYWRSRKLGPYAAVGDFVAVGRGINRGNPKSRSKANHEAERVRASEAALTQLGKAVPSKTTTRPIVMVNPPETWEGDRVTFYVQTLLSQKGWHEVGMVDGKPGRRTEAAVLAFRNEHSPPLRMVNHIDQELVTALEVSPSRPVSSERAKTTAADLASAGDETVSTVGSANKVVAAGGLLSLFGGADQQGLTDRAKEVVSGGGALREMAEQALDLLQWAAQKWWIPVLLLCVYLYMRNQHIISKRVEEFRVGKTPAV